jgi:hypothetical protein
MAQTFGNSNNLQVSLAGPFGGGSGTGVKLVEVTLFADSWKGATSPYSQVVAVEGVSINSMVNLQPTVEQLEIFHDKDLAFVAENEDGVVTVYAVGDKPSNDYTMQASIMEVTA